VRPDTWTVGFHREWRRCYWTEPGVIVSFMMNQGRATGFEVRTESGMVAPGATRVR
jgi:hypothetical protein